MSAADALLAAGTDSGLSYAEINGTILAIIVAALSGYLVVLFQARDRLITEIINYANDMVEFGGVLEVDPLVDALTDAQLRQLFRALRTDRRFLTPALFRSKVTTMRHEFACYCSRPL